MIPSTLATFAGVSACQLAEIHPAGLCLAFGANSAGKLQLTLSSTNDDAVDITIDEDTDDMTADILSEEMTIIMRRYA